MSSASTFSASARWVFSSLFLATSVSLALCCSAREVSSEAFFCSICSRRARRSSMTFWSLSMISLMKSMALSKSEKLAESNSTDQYDTVPRSSIERTRSQNFSYWRASSSSFSRISCSVCVISVSYSLMSDSTPLISD